MTVYDIINNISKDKEKYSREVIEEFYNPFVVIDFFSKFEDAIVITNELNSFKSPVSNYEHYLYLHSLMRKHKRTIRNIKKNTIEEENISAVMEYYEFSREKAKEIIEIIGNINIEEIKKYLNDKGGLIK